MENIYWKMRAECAKEEKTKGRGLLNAFSFTFIFHTFIL